jgi:hypothetical protein
VRRQIAAASSCARTRSVVRREGHCGAYSPVHPQMNGLAGAHDLLCDRKRSLCCPTPACPRIAGTAYTCANDLQQLVPCRGCSHCHHAAMFGAQLTSPICRGVRCRRLRTHPAKADRQAERPRSSWPACGVSSRPWAHVFRTRPAGLRCHRGRTCVTFDEAHHRPQLKSLRNCLQIAAASLTLQVWRGPASHLSIQPTL